MPTKITQDHPEFQRLLKSPYGKRLIKMAVDPDNPLEDILGPHWGPKIKYEIYTFDLLRPQLGLSKSLAKAIAEEFSQYLVWLSVMESGKREDKARRQKLGPKRIFKDNLVNSYIRDLIVGDEEETRLVDDLKAYGFDQWSKDLYPVPISKIRKLAALLEEGYSFDTDAAFDLLAPYASNSRLLTQGQIDQWLELYEESLDT